MKRQNIKSVKSFIKSFLRSNSFLLISIAKFNSAGDNKNSTTVRFVKN